VGSVPTSTDPASSPGIPGEPQPGNSAGSADTSAAGAGSSAAGSDTAAGGSGSAGGSAGAPGSSAGGSGSSAGGSGSSAGAGSSLRGSGSGGGGSAARREWRWPPGPGDGHWSPEWGWGPPGGRRRYRPGSGRATKLAMFVAVVQVVGTYFAARHDQGLVRPLGWQGYSLLVLSAAAMAGRRAHRIPALILTIAATLAYYVLAFPGGPYFVAAFFSIAGAIIAGRRRMTWLVTSLAYAFVISFSWFVPTIDGYPVPRPSIGGAIAVGAWLLVTLAVAEAIRNRASALAEVARTRTEQARTRSEQQRRQASEERLRIAQELHDVVGHHLSLINVQAGVGLHLMDEHPEQARVALGNIKLASSEALAEVRAVLGLLRAENGEAAPRAPASSLADLSVLLETAGAALVTTGQRRALPAEVDRAAYRIVREALTNARRHAGEAATATVTIGYRPDVLSICVADDGVGVTGELAEGNGLAGMRARAEALGGSLVAGARSGGGFEVCAELPAPQQPAPETSAPDHPPAGPGVATDPGPTTDPASATDSPPAADSTPTAEEAP